MKSGALARLLAIALSAAGGAGCGPVLTEPVAPGEQLEEEPSFGVEPPYVRAGDTLETRVLVLGVQAATMKAQACGQAAAGEPLRVTLTGQSTGLLAMVKHAVVEMETTLGSDLSHPEANWADAEIGPKRRHYEVRFGGSSYRYRYERNYGEPISGTVSVPGNGRAHDMLSALVALRTWRPSPGTRAEFHAVLGRRLWQVDVTFLGADVILRDEEPWPAVRLKGVANKLHHDPKKRLTRHFEMWFSDDPDRIPLRIKTESSFGDIWVEMTDYRTNERCAPRAPRPPVQYLDGISGAFGLDAHRVPGEVPQGVQ